MAKQCIIPCSYIIEQDVCFLTLCDRGFNKKLAYSFLEDLSQEFYSQYGHKINTANRPYSFIEFGKRPTYECNITFMLYKLSTLKAFCTWPF